MFRVLHSQHSELAEERKGVPANVTSDGKEKFLEGLCRKAKHTVGGFQFFAKHRLCLAGVSVAMLYLTVLGFDSITISFCKASGVDESLECQSSLSAMQSVPSPSSSHPHSS